MMGRKLSQYRVLSVAVTGWFACLSSVSSAAGVDPIIEKALATSPRQANIAIETVAAGQIANCTKRPERRGDVEGLLILGPNSEPLRWFGDVNKDRAIDIWSYYNHGVEVYRDIDTDFNRSVDQTRWFGTSGIRWGIDKNEDGAIDSWKVISPEEVTMEVVTAVRENAVNRFLNVLLSEEELADLQLGESKEKELRDQLQTARADFEQFAKTQKSITANSKWTNFGADKPGVVPSGTNGSLKDIVAYENVVAIVETDQQNDQLMVGALVQISENQWRVTGIPRLVSENAMVNAGSVFFGSAMEQIASTAIGGGLSEKSQQLLKDLEAIEEDLNKATEPSQKQSLNLRRAEVMEAIFEESANPQDKETWARQFADTVSSATQSKEFDTGLERLKSFEKKVASLSEAGEAYVAFRVISTDYTTKVADASNTDFAEIQTNYLKQLESYVEQFPQSPDAAEAMVQLGINAELQMDSAAAEKWYKKTAESFADTQSGKKATGAIARLTLKGKVISNLNGKTVDGKAFTSAKSNAKAPTIVHFWATWCEPCKEDMKKLRQLQVKFAKSKLNIVGINLDNKVTDVQKFLANRENDYPWTHLYEEGSFDGSLPMSLGVFSLPVTIVLDSNNTVILSTSHYTPEVETLIEEALKAK